MDHRRSRTHGPGQSGRDQYGYGGSGGATYGAGGYGPYTGESGGTGPREDPKRDDPFRLTGHGGSQGGYGSSFYEAARGRGRSREAPAEYRGEVPQGGSFFGANHPESSEPRRRMFRRGPKGYQRSDERLREDISERLMRAMHIDSSDVSITVTDGKVILEGTVADRAMKHAIEDLADACPGVQDVENRIRVRREADRSDR